MKVMNVSLFQFGVSDPQAGGSSRPAGERTTARIRPDRGRGSGRIRTRRTPTRVRHSRTANFASAVR